MSAAQATAGTRSKTVKKILLGVAVTLVLVVVGGGVAWTTTCPCETMPGFVLLSVRTWLTRRSPSSSCHMLPPPAPQQSPPLRLRRISSSSTPGRNESTWRGASYTPFSRPR